MDAGVTVIDVNVTLTDDGADLLAQMWTGVLPLQTVDYYKIGEGGYSDSPLQTHNIAVGDGGKTYSGTAWVLPIVPSSFRLEDLVGAQVLTDDGAGNLTGAGTGTVDYKTGIWSATFTASVGVGDDIEIRIKTRGVVSAAKSQDLGPGKGTAGPYFDTLAFAAEDVPIQPGTVTISDGAPSAPQTVTDSPNDPFDNKGTFSGAGTGEIDYATGEYTVEFTAVVPVDQIIQATAFKYLGAPDDAASFASLTDIQAEADPDLYFITKSFETGDFTEVGNSPWRIRAAIDLALHEALDTGDGSTPYLFEAGLFLEDDTMVAYVTFTKTKKNGSTILDLDVDTIR